jgi:hypothetical protein
MRLGVSVSRQLRLVVGVYFAMASSIFAGDQALAASGQMFPVGSNLVAVVVAAAFILPAGIAGFVSVVKRAARTPAGVLGVGLLAIGTVAVLALANPGLLSSLRV